MRFFQIIITKRLKIWIGISSFWYFKFYDNCPYNIYFDIDILKLNFGFCYWRRDYFVR